MHFLRSPRPLVRLAAAGALVALSFTGCGKSDAPEQSGGKPEAPPAVQQPAGAAVTAQPVAAPKVKPADWDRLHQSFKDATRAEPPEGERPPDATRAGKSVGKVYSEVVKSWDSIRFYTDDGRRVHYTAVLETGEGTVEIELRPDAAPNHVRSFIALVRAGYYDGLLFDRVHHEESEVDSQELRCEEIEAGCPLGTGDHASVGYWLNAEFNDSLKHEEGTVGACRGFDPDTACCRFYIILNRAPYLDGHYTTFGKVTKGLEAARKIFLKPVILDDRDVNGNRRPLEPVLIKKVTVQSREEAASEHVSKR